MNSTQFSWIAASAFGLEGAISGELKRLGMSNVHSENGFVRFTGTLQDAWKANLSVRFSDRIFLLLKECDCYSFEDLYQNIYSIPWENYTSGKEAFNVTAQCARSKLMSVRDCQSVSKKALINRLKEYTKQEIFPETGFAFPVHIAIHTNHVRIMLNTSGPSLSRRGYRTWNGEAPLRETLAASLVEYSPWRPGMPLYDPCCGTATILIEAALRMGHIAPGLQRNFAMEQFSFFPRQDAYQLKTKIQEQSAPERIAFISGSDISDKAIELANKHINQANLQNRINVSVQSLQNVNLTEKNGVFICNPPYGERLNTKEQCHELYHDLSELQRRHPTWNMCAISSDTDFEKSYGRRADRKRKLYNGTIECYYYCYHALIRED